MVEENAKEVIEIKVKQEESSLVCQNLFCTIHFSPYHQCPSEQQDLTACKYNCALIEA